MANGSRVDWPGEVVGGAIYISGSQTDWLNQGMARSHSIIPEHENNSHLRPVRGLLKLRRLRPVKFHRYKDKALASCMSVGGGDKTGSGGFAITYGCFQHGLNPSAYSLHSLRAGGSTALYRSTGNIELAARMGRRETRSI